MVPSSAIVRWELSAPFSEFDLMANMNGFIAPQVLRPRLVGVQAANIGKIKLEQILASRETSRAPGAGYGRDDMEFDQYSYNTQEKGWEVPVDDHNAAVYKDVLDAEETASNRSMYVVVEGYERDTASSVFDTTVWTGASLTTAVSTPWDTHASATPIDDVNAAREKVVQNCGMEPNALIINRPLWRDLINCAQIVDRVKYAEKATSSVLAQAVADVLDIERVIVAGGIKNSANVQQSRSNARIWSNTMAMLARVAVSDDPQEPCIGRTFMWTGDGPDAVGTAEELAVIIEEYREENVRGTVFRARNNRDIQIMYKQAGHLLTSVRSA
jgi:hypothetical protein